MGNPISWVGQTVKDYKLIRFLGDGGMGMVFEAQKISLGKKVAIKLLNPILCAQETLRKRFFQEAKVTATLNHPNIVSINEVGEYEGLYFIEMEFIGGPTLNEHIKDKGALESLNSLGILKQIAKGLEFAHNKKILHRDIKPSNVMFTSHGAVKITDFGLAKFLDQDSGLSKSGEFLGSPHFMAPEILASDREIDGRVDIYALGITFYQMLVGDTPFEGKSPLQIAYKHVTQPLPSIRSFNPKIPEVLELFLKELTEKNPDMRLATASIVLKKIEQIEQWILDTTTPTFYIGDKAISQRSQKDWDRLQNMMPGKKRYKKVLVFVALFLLSCMGLVGFGLFGKSNNIQENKEYEKIWAKISKYEQNRNYAGVLQVLDQMKPDYQKQKRVIEKRKKIQAKIAKQKELSSLLDRAQKLFKNEEYDKALKICGKIINLYPGTFFGKKAQELEQQITTLLSQYQLAQSLWERGKEKIRKKEYKAALEIFDKLLQRFPKSRYVKEIKRERQNLLEQMTETSMAKILWDKVKEKITEQKYEIALDYVDEILTKYKDSRYAPLAQSTQAKLVRVLQKQLKKEKYFKSSTIKIQRLISQKKNKEAVSILKKLSQTFSSNELVEIKEYAKERLCPFEKTISLGPDTNIQLVLVLPGKFTMGTSENKPYFKSDERQHVVSIKQPFYIGRYEITNRQYNMWKNDKNVLENKSNHPVTNVSWEDANSFCSWLSKKLNIEVRLPSEAEWEYACRAGSKTKFSWGDKASKELANYTWEKNWISYWRSHKTIAIGKYSPNAWGIYDMHGNVWEWTGSPYSFEYDGSEQKIMKKKYMVVRGGGWNCHEDMIRCSNRVKTLFYKKNPWTGFRIVVDIPKEYLILW